MTIWVDGSNIVVQADAGDPAMTPANIPGCTVVKLTSGQEAAFKSLLSQPGGGFTFDGKAFTALPVPAPVPTADPLKKYRDALANAANADPALSADTKTALGNLLTAMAPR